MADTLDPAAGQVGAQGGDYVRVYLATGDPTAYYRLLATLGHVREQVELAEEEMQAVLRWQREQERKAGD